MVPVKFRSQKCLALTFDKEMMCSIPLLKYRETEGIKVQQNAIDKAKGIVAKPMPRYWHDRHSVNQIEDPEERRFQLSIVADKKPYFMRYVYPTLSRQYNTYIKTTNKNARREFGLSIEELEQIPMDSRTDRQNDFIRYYYSRIPVGIGDCVMNRICRRFEQEFDGYLRKHRDTGLFDFSIMKSNSEYTKPEFRAISRLYDSYRNKMKQFVVFRSYERVDDYDAVAYIDDLRVEFERECDIVCPNHLTQCDILLDLCYTKMHSKKFAWEMCGDQMVSNLLARNGGKITYLTLDDAGCVKFRGMRFRSEEVEMEGKNGDRVE